MAKLVLLDENLSHRLRLVLPGHDVRTVAYQGWTGKRNGELIALAEEAGFQVFVTADQGLNYQQNLAGRALAFVVLSTNREKLVLGCAARILEALDRAEAGGVTHVLIGPELRSESAENV